MSLTDDQIQDIIQQYTSGIAPSVIGKQYGIYSNSVTRIIRKNGIERNQHGKVLTTAERKKAVTDYVSGISSEIIARNMNVDAGVIIRELKKNNIPIRPATENKRKYKINENYFEIIDTQEKAYWLGFLYADGHISSRGNDITLGLHPKDNEILEKFSMTMYGFSKLYIGGKLIDGTHYYSVTVTSEKMHRDLCNHGCTPRKSFDIRFPNFLSYELLQHFIRGYFDGDGCISLKADGSNAVDITSNYEFICGIHQYINDVLKVKTGKPMKRHKDRAQSTGNFQVRANNQIEKFMDYIYKDATIYMQRKYDIYQQFLKNQTSKQSKTAQKANDPSKYGTSYMATYNGSQLTTEYVQSLLSDQKNDAADEVFAFYRQNGFPYTTLTKDELIRDFSMLRDIDVSEFIQSKNIPTFNPAGIDTFKHFAPHFWETRSEHSDRLSMLDTFNDDELFMKVIKNRLDAGYNITGNMIKQGLLSSKIAYRASIFFPIVAKTIYSAFCQENDIIYDYSMGFGQRLLGALSLPFNVKYIGVDPYEKSYQSNVNIHQFLSTNVPMLNKIVDLVCEGSENYCNEQYIGKVRLAFSSPPYFNLEVYDDSEKQAYYGNQYAEFINGWWRKTVANISKMLQNGGIFAINMKEYVDKFNILRDMCGVLQENGFKQIDQYTIQLSRNTTFMNANGEHKFEPIVIFQRQ